MSTYTSVHLAERPKADITDKTFTLQSHPLPKESDLKDGQVIFQSLYLSLDPAMRGWLNDARSYVPPVKIGEVMRGAAIGVIRASKSAQFPVGAYAYGHVGWTEVSVVKDKYLEKVEVPKNAKVTDMLGVLGLPGLTAYFGILDVGKVKAGDVVVVSGAAGATGSTVVQIAKLKGARVVAIAGTDDKCKWLVDELNVDVALNYKSPDFRKQFKTATPNFIDVFFDNVGGDILDMALARAKEHARFVICGAISQYNAEKPAGPKNYMAVISMRIRMEGFIVMDYEKQYPEARREIAQWIAEGKVKSKETIIKGGLKVAPKTLNELYKGINTGKLLVEVSKENATAKL